jgi:hypothetical protein
VLFEWVKGHINDLDRDTTKLERMNIVADELCDVIRETVRGPFDTIPNCGLWHNERFAIFIRGEKIMSNWKERLKVQLLDGDLQEYLMQKEQWSTHSFNNICWKRNETALKRISKACQAKIEKMCHNLRHTRALNKKWYGEAKPCFMCGDHEDWRHVLTCKSLDAELIRSDSWSKLRTHMDKWSL